MKPTREPTPREIELGALIYEAAAELDRCGQLIMQGHTALGRRGPRLMLLWYTMRTLYGKRGPLAYGVGVFLVLSGVLQLLNTAVLLGRVLWGALS